MEKSYILLVILTAVTTVTCTQCEELELWAPAGHQCGCFNNVYVRRPTVLDECQPKKKFLDQIKGNFDNIEYALSRNGDPYGCNFDDYRTILFNMKQFSHQLVDTYFSCTDLDCTPLLNNVFTQYAQYRVNVFRKYVRCIYVILNPICAQVLIHTRAAVGNFDNLLVGLLACAKYKLEAGSATLVTDTPSSTASPVPPTNNTVECNCVPSIPITIPEGRQECTSDKYVAETTRIGFKRDRNFSKIQSKNPKTDEIAMKYNSNLRNFIVNNLRTCYFSLTKARQNPLAITEAVIAVLTKCVGYVDKSADVCSQYVN